MLGPKYLSKRKNAENNHCQVVHSAWEPRRRMTETDNLRRMTKPSRKMTVAEKSQPPIGQSELNSEEYKNNEIVHILMVKGDADRVMEVLILRGGGGGYVSRGTIHHYI